MSMEYERIKWACRRGMLELDLIFESYILKRYHVANEQERQQFVAFLSESDQDLFDWLLKKKPAPSPAFQKMIEILLQNDQD